MSSLEQACKAGEYLGNALNERDVKNQARLVANVSLSHSEKQVQNNQYERFALEQQRLAFQSYIPSLRALTSHNQEALCAPRLSYLSTPWHRHRNVTTCRKFQYRLPLTTGWRSLSWSEVSSPWSRMPQRPVSWMVRCSRCFVIAESGPSATRLRTIL